MGIVDGLLALATKAGNDASAKNGLTTITPKYSGDYLNQLSQYQSAVQKIDPSYSLSQGIYSPDMGNSQKQMGDLINMLKGVTAGKKIAAEGKPVDLSQYHLNSLYGNDKSLPPAIAREVYGKNLADQKKANTDATKMINQYLDAAQAYGTSKQDAIYSLFEQLSNKKTKNIDSAMKLTDVGQQTIARQQPAYQLGAYVNQNLLPQAYAQAQDILNTANALDFYDHATSKQRTAMGGKPSTAGLGKLLGIPLGVPINAQTLRLYTQQFLSPAGLTNYITNQVTTEAKQRGTEENNLSALQTTSSEADKALGPNASPLDKLIYDYMQGGAVGVKKGTTNVGSQFMSFPGT